jgi:hypothetical protein
MTVIRSIQSNSPIFVMLGWMLFFSFSLPFRLVHGFGGHGILSSTTKLTAGPALRLLPPPRTKTSSSNTAPDLGASLAPQNDARDTSCSLPFWGTIRSTSFPAWVLPNSKNPRSPSSFLLSGQAQVMHALPAIDPLQQLQSLWKSVITTSTSQGAEEPEANTAAATLGALLLKSIAPIRQKQPSSSALSIGNIIINNNNNNNNNNPVAVEGIWAAYLDQQPNPAVSGGSIGTGLYYYYNRRTGTCRWTAPYGRFRDLKQQQHQQQQQLYHWANNNQQHPLLHASGNWEAYRYSNDNDQHHYYYYLVYYYNRVTKVSTWERPSIFRSSKHAKSEF